MPRVWHLTKISQLEQRLIKEISLRVAKNEAPRQLGLDEVIPTTIYFWDQVHNKRIGSRPVHEPFKFVDARGRVSITRCPVDEGAYRIVSAYYNPEVLTSVLLLWMGHRSMTLWESLGPLVSSIDPLSWVIQIDQYREIGYEEEKADEIRVLEALTHTYEQVRK